ncbi:hypothetical protein GCM10025883_31180 [Mobilicoccus caccae]|uniref:MobA-like NTP transferase domain-containing protein n=1 Tax=Mobilicoccus caccae TaxID=1859295 RepID=A0ABQ6IWK1_9MICO|nr:hypothetical protein GCM10025883_31180 [Mobilicoccus caccae]
MQRQLALLDTVPDVRIVVGFEEQAVIDEARRHRPDILVVRNPAYASTTTLDSYALGARHLGQSCLFMDADILFEPGSLGNFVTSCDDAPVIGYTDAKTVDAVFVAVESELVTSFSREQRTPFEWANIAFLPPGYCEGGARSVYEHLSPRLPLRGRYIDSYEIDRPEDLEMAEKGYIGLLAVAAAQQGAAASSAAQAAAHLEQGHL